MNQTLQQILWAAGSVVVTLLLVAFLHVGGASILNGAITAPWTTLTALQLQQGLRIPGGPGVSTNGSSVQALFKGTCSLINSGSFTIVASTSVAMDCAVTGVKPGDEVLAIFATSTASITGPGWELTGASASSTAGFITFSVTNGTGATALMPASLASTTQYLILR